MIPPSPWTVEVDDFAYEVRVKSADGRTVCIVPMSIKVTDHHAPAGVRRTVDREAALEVARQLAAAPALAEACRSAAMHFGHLDDNGSLSREDEPIVAQLRTTESLLT